MTLFSGKAGACLISVSNYCLFKGELVSFINSSQWCSLNVVTSRVSFVSWRIWCKLHIKCTTLPTLAILCAMKVWFISMFYNMNIMYTTGNCWEAPLLFYTSLLPSILTSSFLPHWEDIWSPTRPALCSPPPLPQSFPPPILSTPLSTRRDPLRHRARDSSDPPMAFYSDQRSLHTSNVYCVILSSRDDNLKHLRGMNITQIFWLVSTQHVTAIKGLNCIDNTESTGHFAV